MVHPKTLKPTGQDTLELAKQALQIAGPEDPLTRLDTTLRSHSAQFDKMLLVIAESKTALEAKFKTVFIEVNMLRVYHYKLTERVDDTESTLRGMRPTLQGLQTRVQELQTKVDMLHRRTEDVEGRSCGNNVQFLGFPKGTEGPNVELLLKNWLMLSILKDRVSTFFSMERAHPIPARLPPPGDKLRPMIALFPGLRLDRAVVSLKRPLAI
ncbi:hypothetical protein NDU88_005128 [Pleurodeles waltl]|uniref:Uncharacterized protein n=1 Tax=Pleurodeles waltl TaxID=8319 RepID=A0AAV7RMX7_PLEWA|nr:hypothetical protein NDU88_005128 [Pleurodeles waltl]